MARIREKRPKLAKSDKKVGQKKLPRIHSLQPPGFDPNRQLAEVKGIHHRRVP